MTISSYTLFCKLPGNPKGFDIDNLHDPKTFTKKSLPGRLLKRGNNRPALVQKDGYSSPILRHP
jgi:hypothetical protein